MAFGKSLTDRLADQAKARGAKAALKFRVTTRTSGSGRSKPSGVEHESNGASKRSASGKNDTEVAAAAVGSLQGATSCLMSDAPVSVEGVAQPLRAAVPLLRDDLPAQHSPGDALAWLVDLYLRAAGERTRNIALVWPVAPKTLPLVHALATLERWAGGDKRGVRGLIFPVKGNVFRSLNHLRFEHDALLRLYGPLVEGSPHVTRPCREKDAFIFAFNSRLKEKVQPYYMNPSLGELLPHFLADGSSPTWANCEKRLLSHLGAKLQDRSQAAALRSSNCAVIGDPSRAPDALFALDGRLTKTELTRMLKALKEKSFEAGLPEVVLINATANIRKETSGWAGGIARFCLLLEEVFGEQAPGVLIVSDEPHAAYHLRAELQKQDLKRPNHKRWTRPNEFSIKAKPNALPDDGLLSAGQVQTHVPTPRALDAQIVDAKAASVASKFYRIARELQKEKVDVQPLVDAAAFLKRAAGWPCGVRDVRAWLDESEADERRREAMGWTALLPGLTQLLLRGDAGVHKATLTACIQESTKLFASYEEGTPFAHMLAGHVSDNLGAKDSNVTIAFTSESHRRLAERFFSRYDGWPDGASFEQLRHQVRLVSPVELEDAMSAKDKGHLVFAGLTQESLRVLMTDDRVPKHAAVLLTQQNGQYLRAALRPLVERFVEFKSWKPRMESILRGLNALPENDAILSGTELSLPSLRTVREGTAGTEDDDADPHAWTVELVGGRVLRRGPHHRVYVYDPSNRAASSRGFRPVEVRELHPEDSICILTNDLRDQVASVLTAAGIPLQRDMAYEGTLREYHRTVLDCMNDAFPSGNLAQKVRRIREAILQAHPDLAEELPEEQSMREWVNLGKSEFTSFEDLRPQAPAKREHFMAFAKVIGMGDTVAKGCWSSVIMPLRSARRHDGRMLSDQCAHMLLQPESVMVHSNISRNTLKQLFDQARQCLYTVERVVPCQGEKNHG